MQPDEFFASVEERQRGKDLPQYDGSPLPVSTHRRAQGVGRAFLNDEGDGYVPRQGIVHLPQVRFVARHAR